MSSRPVEEPLPAIGFGVLEDEVGLGVSDRGMPREVGQDELAQFGRVSRQHVQQEVVCSGHVEEAHDSRERRGRAPEGLDLGARMLRETDRDERLNSRTQHVGVELDAVPADGAVRLQPS